MPEEILSGVFEINHKKIIPVAWDEDDVDEKSGVEGEADEYYEYTYTNGDPPLTSFEDDDLQIWLYDSESDADADEDGTNRITSGQFFDNIAIVMRDEDSVTVRVRYSRIDIDAETSIYYKLVAIQPDPEDLDDDS